MGRPSWGPCRSALPSPRCLPFASALDSPQRSAVARRAGLRHRHACPGRRPAPCCARLAPVSLPCGFEVPSPSAAGRGPARAAARGPGRGVPTGPGGCPLDCSRFWRPPPPPLRISRWLPPPSAPGTAAPPSVDSAPLSATVRSDPPPYSALAPTVALRFRPAIRGPSGSRARLGGFAVPAVLHCPAARRRHVRRVGRGRRSAAGAAGGRVRRGTRKAGRCGTAVVGSPAGARPAARPGFPRLGSRRWRFRGFWRAPAQLSFGGRARAWLSSRAVVASAPPPRRLRRTRPSRAPPRSALAAGLSGLVVPLFRASARVAGPFGPVPPYRAAPPPLARRPGILDAAPPVPGLHSVPPPASVAALTRRRPRPPSGAPFRPPSVVAFPLHPTLPMPPAGSGAASPPRPTSAGPPRVGAGGSPRHFRRGRSAPTPARPRRRGSPVPGPRRPRARPPDRSRPLPRVSVPASVGRLRRARLPPLRGEGPRGARRGYRGRDPGLGRGGRVVRSPRFPPRAFPPLGPGRPGRLGWRAVRLRPRRAPRGRPRPSQAARVRRLLLSPPPARQSPPGVALARPARFRQVGVPPPMPLPPGFARRPGARGWVTWGARRARAGCP
ncbi:basic proline-rich protein-like [Indicator indicator]|uniref:basic proline-rich protein-like n=1 Tax=Indicator indicator TaxID=1002788 RepID=UPI0023DFC9CE|nr:basic proline-rich protein-like [Indicator indicator]